MTTKVNTLEARNERSGVRMHLCAIVAHARTLVEDAERELTIASFTDERDLSFFDKRVKETIGLLIDASERYNKSYKDYQKAIGERE